MDLNLALSQKQVLSQQMQLSVRILQMNALDLDQYIRDAALENPLIELEAPVPAEDSGADRLKKLEWLESMDESNSFRTSYNYEPDEREQPLYEKRTVDSLSDILLQQLPALRLPDREEWAVRYLVGNLDENGYLGVPRQQLLAELGNEALLNRALSALHRMDPPGVGAVDLRECLLLQAQRQPDPSPVLIRMIDRHLDLLAKNQLSKLAKLLEVPMDAVKDARTRLLTLNPKPGNGYSTYNSIPYIRPDLFIVHFEGEFQIILNDYSQPQIIINSYYRDLAKHADGEERKYISDKLCKAEWMVSCIRQRASTILRCGEQILRWQIRFFEQGPGNIVPMTLADIASQLEMHPSTVSRAVNGKYLQCQWGVFGMGEFFSRAVSEQEQSQDMVMSQIRRIISEEDPAKPFSDQQITERLQIHGVTISRRTVAKYRESMEIPSASGRKSF